MVAPVTKPCRVTVRSLTRHLGCRSLARSPPHVHRAAFGLGHRVRKFLRLPPNRSRNSYWDGRAFAVTVSPRRSVQHVTPSWATPTRHAYRPVWLRIRPAYIASRAGKQQAFNISIAQDLLAKATTGQPHRRGANNPILSPAPKTGSAPSDDLIIHPPEVQGFSYLRMRPASPTLRIF